MSRLRRFAEAPGHEKWLICKAAALLFGVRLLLWTFPYPKVRPLLARACYGAVRNSRSSPEKLAWSVAGVGEIVPGGRHCLSQAITLQILMTRRGFDSRVCFGIHRQAAAPLLAHAWVEYGDKVLIGGQNLELYVRLTRSASGSGPLTDPFS